MMDQVYVKRPSYLTRDYLLELIVRLTHRSLLEYNVQAIKPEVFVMENVVGLMRTDTYVSEVAAVRASGYGVSFRIVCYADHGAATTRRRLFTVGIRKSERGADEFFEGLDRVKVSSRQTVREAIGWARDLPARWPFRPRLEQPQDNF